MLRNKEWVLVSYKLLVFKKISTEKLIIKLMYLLSASLRWTCVLLRHIYYAYADFLRTPSRVRKPKERLRRRLVDIYIT